MPCTAYRATVRESKCKKVIVQLHHTYARSVLIKPSRSLIQPIIRSRKLLADGDTQHLPLLLRSTERLARRRLVAIGMIIALRLEHHLLESALPRRLAITLRLALLLLRRE